MAEAITIFGGRPDALRASKRSNADLLGYCEVHIEQGPVLETLELPIGVVSAIASYSRILTSFSGQAGHAGTVPMHLRRDALSAAAEFVLACEKLACATPGLVATVGQMSVQPGASNVIPGQVTLSLDVRHMDDTRREQARDQLREQALLIGVDRHIAVEWQVVQEHAAVPCDPQLMRLFSQSIERQGLPAYTLPSGAGHDGVILSALTRVAMLFVRCKGGISHHPAESVVVDDVAVAIQVLAQFLLLLAEEGAQQP
jgi:allantoate deiminase